MRHWTRYLDSGCGYNSLKLLNQCLLPCFDLPFCRSHVEKICPVDLRELHVSPRFRRPFNREGVAGDCAWIAVTLERPCVNDLAALLLDRRQCSEGAGWRDASFFFELPLGGFEQIFALLDLALGNRPSQFVLVLEIGTTRMGKEHLQLAIVNAIHQQTSADTGHKHQFFVWG